MRRKEKEIKDKSHIEEIIQSGEVCRIAISGEEFPYIVPVNYGYEDNCLYFHSACEGQKMEMLIKNPNVCIQIDTNISIEETEVPCNWSTNYKSVIAYGKASILNDMTEKKIALGIIVKHYKKDFEESYQFSGLEKLCIVKIALSSLSGKQSL